MKIYSVTDPEFAEFGKVLDGYDTAELVKAMNDVAMPAEGVNYEPWIDSLEKCAIFKDIEENAFSNSGIKKVVFKDSESSIFINKTAFANTSISSLEFYRFQDLW